MAIYAHVSDGVVVDTAVWDGVAPYDPENVRLVRISEGDEPLPGMPGIGWTFDETVGFRPPQPFPSWRWNDSEWSPPVARPTDGGDYVWDEVSQFWIDKESLISAQVANDSTVEGFEEN